MGRPFNSRPGHAVWKTPRFLFLRFPFETMAACFRLEA